MKINKGKIIKKCIEEELSDLDFHYESYEDNTWVFARKLGKLTWYVYIYVYRFDPWQITFHLGTDVPGKMQVQAHQIEDVKGDGDIPGYWKYHDEENLKRWFDYMDSRIEEMKRGAYDSGTKEELLEMAAFLGEQIVKYKGGSWKLWKNEKVEATNITYIKKIGKNEEVEECINLIRVLVRRYLGNNRNWLEEPFFEVISEWNV